MPERPNFAMWSGLLTTAAVVVTVSLTLWADFAVCKTIGPGDGAGKTIAFILKVITVVPITLVGLAVTLVILFTGIVGALLGVQSDRRKAVGRLMQEVERAERENR